MQGCGAPWVVQLFGMFQATAGGVRLGALPGRRTKELLGYLFLSRQRPHHREVLATLLWPDSNTAQSRKYLRQDLWHLRTLERTGRKCAPLMRVHDDWVQANTVGVRLDVAELEDGLRSVRSLSVHEIRPEQADELRRLVPLYRGDLLEDCYQDWCINERERLRAMYISLLEKLLGYCELHNELEEGLVYGERLLHQEPAHERAHWRLMRLRYLDGDRTGALRQFERCRDALREGLGVEPGARIMALYEQIRADRGLDQSLSPQPRRLAAAPGHHPETGAPGGIRSGNKEPLEAALASLRLAERLVELTIRHRSPDR